MEKSYPSYHERPTPEIRWKDGVLQQRFERICYRWSGDHGVAMLIGWRAVPNADDPEPKEWR